VTDPTARVTDIDAALADEPALVARVQRGDRDAFGTLVTRHIDRAKRIAWRLVRQEQDAEDVVQDAFLRALERIDQCEAGRPFGPWFWRIVVTTALNRTRADRRRPTEALEEVGLERVGTTDAPDLVFPALQADVAKALSALPAQQRAIVELIAYEEFTPQEVAASFDMPAGTVRWHLHEARRTLRRRLHAWVTEEPEE
jgi:RNA polymerase sigma-70 factor, ECF subfamily